MNHIKDVMGKVSSTMIKRESLVRDAALIISDRIGYKLPTSMLRFSNGRLIVSAPPSVRQIVFLRKEEIIVAINNRLGGSHILSIE